MRIADLDLATKRVIFWAASFARSDTPENFKNLKQSVADWEKTHEKERAENLFRNLADLEKFIHD